MFVTRRWKERTWFWHEPTFHGKLKDTMYNKKGQSVVDTKLKGDLSDHLRITMSKCKQHLLYHAYEVFSICTFDRSMIRQGIIKPVKWLVLVLYYSTKTLKEASLPTANRCIILTWKQVYRQEAKGFLVLVHRRIMRWRKKY